MELPRHSQSYSYIPNKDPSRNCVLLLKHKGSKREPNEYPQYEPIAYGSKDKGFYVVYSVDIFECCNSIFETMCNSYTLRYDRHNNNMSLYKNMNIINNIVNIIEEFNINIVSQHIDTCGLVRSLLLSNDVVVDIPPTYPRDLPIFDRDTISLPSHMSCIRTFGNPTFVELTPDVKSYTGLWFKLYNMDKGIYCPFKRIPLEDPVFDGAERSKCVINPYDQQLSIIRIRKLKKTLDKLMQLYKWLLILYLKQGGEFVNFSTRFLVGDDNVDSLNVYNFGSLKRYFPKLDTGTFEEALEKIYNVTHGIIKDQNGQYLVYMYNDEFYGKVIYSLKRFYIEYYMYEYDIPVKFSKYYRIESDFDVIPGTSVIIGKDNYDEWLSSRERTSLSINVVTKLKITFCSIRQEYFLSISQENVLNAPLSSLYMIQNVFYGLESAINVAYIWYKSKINLGYIAKKYKSDKDSSSSNVVRLPYHIIYSISLSYIPIVTIDNSNGSTNFLEILHYGGNRYAAMIRMI